MNAELILSTSNCLVIYQKKNYLIFIKTLTSLFPYFEVSAFLQFYLILDAGVLAVTFKQKSLESLVLKNLVQLTPKGLGNVKSSSLHTLNLKGCTLMTSRGKYSSTSYVAPGLKNLDFGSYTATH